MPTLRIEFIKASSPKNGTPDGTPAASSCLLEKELPITSTATASADQPAAPEGATHAVLFAVGGGCYVDYDNQKGNNQAAAPGSAPRLYVPSGQARVITGFAVNAKFATVLASIS